MQGQTNLIEFSTQKDSNCYNHFMKKDLSFANFGKNHFGFNNTVYESTNFQNIQNVIHNHKDEQVSPSDYKTNVSNIFDKNISNKMTNTNFDLFENCKVYFSQSCKIDQVKNQKKRFTRNKINSFLQRRRKNRLASFANHLAAVITSHAKVQVYDCLFLDCMKSYDSFQKWKYHYDSHSDKREHICEFCNKGFNLRSNYKAHAALHVKKLRKEDIKKYGYFRIDKVEKKLKLFDMIIKVDNSNNNINKNEIKLKDAENHTTGSQMDSITTQEKNFIHQSEMEFLFQ